jgi:hypothetical protein
MEAIIGIALALRPGGGGTLSQDLQASENSNGNLETTI